MAEYTKYLRLMKPDGNEYYNVENFNHNAELIDKETDKLNNAVTKIQEGATKEKAGIVQFGTEEGKALEGMMLARLAGCVGYGGDVQTAGVKDINYIYYDRNTRKMYKCLNQNSDVSANVANFIPLDNNSLLDRLENLCKSEKLYEGKAESVGLILINNLPFWVKTLKIQGSNDDGYYFQDVYISVDTLKEKTVFVSIGTLNDIRSYGLSLKNGVLKIENAGNLDKTADNNYIRKIYGLSY